MEHARYAEIARSGIALLWDYCSQAVSTQAAAQSLSLATRRCIRVYTAVYGVETGMAVLFGCEESLPKNDHTFTHCSHIPPMMWRSGYA